MAFQSWQSFWKFSEKIIHNNRYIHDDETSTFLNEVLLTCENRKKIIKKGNILWRAQLGCDIQEEREEERPYSKDRMYPVKNLASEGRINPKGIPYLYLSTTTETAMSEIRPWVGSEISVAQFQIVRDATIIDCSLNHLLKNPLYYNNGLYEPEEIEREKAVWTHIDKAFSTPIIPNENEANYVPTQVLSELFKNNGFDGIYYKSSLNKDGFNICLFDLNLANLINCFLFKPFAISFEFEEIANPYFVGTINN